ncbi:hypothetical protein H310_09726, partial [Aphanomyces invadans]
MFTLLQLVTFVAAAVASTTDANWRLPSNEIGSDHSLNLVATKSKPFNYVIQDDGASYIAPHFNELSIPNGGVLEIRALDGSQKVRYTGSRSDFYADATVEVCVPMSSKSSLEFDSKSRLAKLL